MKSNAARVIENVAASVADGARVDWERAGTEVSGRELRLVRHLRLIDSVAEVYRTLPPLAEDDGTGAIARPDYPEGPRWGRLILLDRIGHGASADVFRAWDAELQREVALKLLHDERTSGDKANAHLLGEARRLARIRHPNVVHVYGAERHEERIGLWMELVRGRSLDETVRQEGPFPIAEAMHIGVDLCSALGAVHGAGLLHRDVKAQNVVREDSGRIVLMDFGTGQEIEDGTPRLAGTPIYLAPEIIRHGPASVQSDLYSVGVLLFYLMTGQFPVTGQSLDGLAEAHRAGELRSVRDVRHDVPAGVARVIDRALAPQASRRYASASAMEAALRQALDAVPGQRQPMRRQWWMVAGAAVATAALVGTLMGRRPSVSAATADATAIAVLPLQFEAGESEAPYLADALTDQIITTLGQVQSLRVTARTSVAQFRNTHQSVASIAQQLGVGSVVEGSVAVQHGTGNGAGPPSVRVNVRLIRAGSDVGLWSSSFDRQLGDMFALETDIARSIARQVKAVLTPDERARLTQRQSTSPEAERAYLEGRALMDDYGIGNATRALSAFESATRLDPNHAQGYAAAARTYMTLGLYGLMSQPAVRASALSATTRALKLDEGLAEAHIALADIRFYYDRDWVGAEQEYRRAVDLNPGLVYALTEYARYLSAAGRLQEAVARATQAARLDPLSSDAVQTLGLVQYYARDYDGAVVTLTKALAINPSYARAHFVLGRVYEAQGRLPEAMAETKRAMTVAGTPTAGWEAQLLRLRALQGDTDAARAGYEALEAKLASNGQTLSGERAAYVYAALGEHERAIDELEKCVAAGDPTALWLNVDPRFDSLRTSPRFTELMRQLGVR